MEKAKQKSFYVKSITILILLLYFLLQINNIIDTTYYVFIECGQPPMHAFDYVCFDDVAMNVRKVINGEYYAAKYRSFFLTIINIKYNSY